MAKKLVMLLGIRPDVIRCSVLIKMLKNALRNDFVFIWSGQHYSDNMKDIFFRELEVPLPDITFNIDTSSDVHTISSLNLELNNYLQSNDVAAVVYLGDTNTVASAITCAANNIPIVHIEGCMRSYDWRMPEEKYRTQIDHLADVIYAYLDEYKNQGITEGIAPERIVVTGNPIVDVLDQYFLSGKLRLDKSALIRLLSRYGVQENNYWLMTCHRRENIDDFNSLTRIIDLCAQIDKKIIFPAGYRTQRRLNEFGLELPSNLMLIDPVGYIELLELMKNSISVLTDSGTIVEEASIIGIPSIQMRLSTERPQVYDVGGSVKYDPTVNHDNKYLKRMIINCESRKATSWEQPFGDGSASRRIQEDLLDRYHKNAFGTHNPKISEPQVERNFGYGISNKAKVN